MQQLLNAPDDELKALVDVMQEVCVSSTENFQNQLMELRQSTSSTYRLTETVESILYNVARKRGILPSSYYISDVLRIGAHPVGGGSFSDVYKGEIQGKPVALKVLRIFQNTVNREGIMRVSSVCYA